MPQLPVCLKIKTTQRLYNSFDDTLPDVHEPPKDDENVKRLFRHIHSSKSAAGNSRRAQTPAETLKRLHAANDPRRTQTPKPRMSLQYEEERRRGNPRASLGTRIPMAGHRSIDEMQDSESLMEWASPCPNATSQHQRRLERLSIERERQALLAFQIPDSPTKSASRPSTSSRAPRLSRTWGASFRQPESPAKSATSPSTPSRPSRLSRNVREERGQEFSHFNLVQGAKKFFYKDKLGVATYTPLKELFSLAAIFRQLDADNSGTVNVREMQEYAQKHCGSQESAVSRASLAFTIFGKQLSPNKLPSFLKNLDRVLAKSKAFNLEEFIQLAHPTADQNVLKQMLELIHAHESKDKGSKPVEISEEKQAEIDQQTAWVDEMWDYWDADGNGELDPQELSSVLQDIGASEKEAVEYFYEIDVDDSGLISKDEFLDWWLGQGRYMDKSCLLTELTVKL
ncbi:hypothetical protein CYMTET_42489 [Cymbomonas tetramitiformis]|uniref:EF-hand domain-containing protein n=1 Tax=Cymbomonas tetramitiformis TaxID=36881 RepID=A0AAE0EX72_9CHLO|nr:hypothetical protein CYMTET_46874 [Cymbomonas tetramitiformis]KAK3248029.1 hypothetical protein CYMTET_42489 [Cymbomonas tetramitiformis]